MAKPPRDPSLQDRLRRVPAVGALLERPVIARSVDAHGRATVVRAVRSAVADARRSALAGGSPAVSDDDIVKRARDAASGTLRPVLNATGVVVHTNLGRAPLAAEALDAAREASEGYSTLEYDLAEGARGDRRVHTVELLAELTGAEDAVVVNNNCAALLLALATLAAGREVVVSRGELVEIGGGFRVPDVLAQSGARLVEVGTTNRTHPDDYARAIGPDTALVLKVHRSNFAMVGFTAEVSVARLAELARERGVALLYDAGSGTMGPLAAESGEAPVAHELKAGADVVTFSGDKLLGGPQAGIAVGRRDAIARMRRHPLFRALRPDKLCLAALGATLALWRDAPEQIPVYRMLTLPRDVLERRTRRLVSLIGGRGGQGGNEVSHVGGGAGRGSSEGRAGAGAAGDSHPPLDLSVIPATGRIGGGAAPTRELASIALALRVPDPGHLLARLRAGPLPVIARIEDGAVLLDLRCIEEKDDDALARIVSAVLEAPAS